jgi:6-phosphogluconolactonase (cycloisomerase 2 family)
MRLINTFAAAATASQITHAVNLFVTSYDGNVTTLSLAGSDNNYTLSESSRIQSCGTQPSWLVYDKPNSVLYCMDENWNFQPTSPSSVFTSFNVDQYSGKLTVAQISNLTTASSVSGVLFGDNKFMAVAGYSGQVSALNVNKTAFRQAQTLDFVNKTELAPGQLTPHPHQTILDPTGQYIVTPDLGGDLLRVFCWASNTGDDILEEHAPFKMNSSSGPRHAAFWKPDPSSNSTDNTYLFVVTELASSLTTYKVSYPSGGGLNFTEINTQNTFGGSQTPDGATAAEIQISPDNRYVVVSNRNDSSFTLDTYSGSSTETELSDSLATYAIDNKGGLTFKQLWPAGGLFPRQFSINKTGDMVAVGLQNSCRVVVLARDVEQGILGQPLAAISLGNCVGDSLAGPTMIVWDD